MLESQHTDAAWESAASRGAGSLDSGTRESHGAVPSIRPCASRTTRAGRAVGRQGRGKMTPAASAHEFWKSVKPATSQEVSWHLGGAWSYTQVVRDRPALLLVAENKGQHLEQTEQAGNSRISLSKRAKKSSLSGKRNQRNSPFIFPRAAINGSIMQRRCLAACLVYRQPRGPRSLELESGPLNPRLDPLHLILLYQFAWPAHRLCHLSRWSPAEAQSSCMASSPDQAHRI